MNEQQLLDRITVNPQIFGGKPIIGVGALQWSMYWECWQQVIYPKP
jgi:hypothetical protein